MGFDLKVAGRTDVGRKRMNNQDSILINEKAQLFAVADGMGGHNGGEVASLLAVKTLDKYLTEAKGEVSVEALRHAISLSSRAIFDYGNIHSELNGMGTTLSVLWRVGDFFYVGQVGDSRVYLMRDQKLFQVTEDHSQVYMMLKEGLVREEEMHLIQKNIITRSVGYENEVEADIFIRPLKKGDRYLICSDGLSGMLNHQEITQVLLNYDPEIAVSNLIELANLRGGEDNVSVIVVHVV